MTFGTRSAVRGAGLGVVLALSVALAAAAAPGGPVLISATSTGAAGSGASGTFGLAISGDGRSVAFSSTAIDLAAADTDPDPDVYVRDVVAGRTVLASASAAGQRGNGMSTRPSLSCDGSRVAFLSLATNLDPVDANPSPDPFVKHLPAGASRVVSTTADGAKGNGASSAVTLSADGAAVAFASTSTNLDPRDADSQPDVYVKDLSTGGLTLASVRADGTKAPTGSFGIGSLSLSADGTQVAFSTDAPFSERDRNGFADVYVKDLRSGRLVLASAGASGDAGNAASLNPMLSVTGGKVVFASFATLDASDGDDASDIYLSDLSTGRLSLVSTNGASEKADRRSTSPAISGDGRVAAFLSEATNLGPQAGDPPQLDAYTKDLASGDVTLASIAADDSRANALSVSPVLSADGSRLTFATPATNLAAEDTNGWADVYLVGGEPAAPCPTLAPEITERPSIAGSATVGESLTAKPGTWLNHPTGVTYQWQACDSSGGNCSPIAGATARTYAVTADDVGHRLRVIETASNAGGSSKAVSAATTVVAPRTPTDTAPPPIAGTAPVGELPTAPAAATLAPPVIRAAEPAGAAEIRAQLLRDIRPRGNASRIRALLRKGGYVFACTGLSAGRMSVAWYLVPRRGPRVRIAAGGALFAAPGKATVTVKLTAKGRRALHRAKSLKLAAALTFERPGQPAIHASARFTVKR